MMRIVDTLKVDTKQAEDAELFEHAPPERLWHKFGLAKRDAHDIRRRALLVALIGWLPLVLLTIAAGVGQIGDGIASLLREVGIHARYLLAAPLLILAERECGSRLNAIVQRFSDSGIVQPHQRTLLDNAVASTRARLRSQVAVMLIVALAYSVVFSSIWSHSVSDIPSWHSGAHFHFSLAGWWHVLVSLPLLLTLVLGWLWRVVLWARLLWLIARLDLRLVASHPDRVGGLGFVGHSVRAFSVVALALATVAAGRSAHLVLVGSSLPTPNLLLNAGLMAAIAGLFTTPLFVFIPTLLQVWRRGVAQYGSLAMHVGTAFEDKWLGLDLKSRDAALEKPDFSATTDLYAVVSNVYALRFVPIDLNSIIVFVCAMLLPFVPVVLLAVPLDRIWANVQKLLF